MTESSVRHYDLDALRAWAMFLGILLHAAIFVLPYPEWRWPMHDPAATGDQLYRLVIDAIHGFRMPVFFLLSGFFSALLVERRGLRGFGVHRLKRVGLPWLISCLTVIPITVWLLKWIANQQSAFTEIYDQLTILATPFIFLFNMGHLWFLWYLLIIAFVYMGLVRVGLSFRSSWWWLVVLASFCATVFMHEPLTFGSDTAVGIIPEPAVLLHYMCFFFFGVFFYQRQFAVRQWWAVALLPAVPAFVTGMWLIGLYRSSNLEKIALAREEGSIVSQYLFNNLHTFMACVAEVAFAWLMCFGLMGLSHFLFRSASATTERVAQYLSDATYWMYLVHLPLVVIAQWLVLNLEISYHIKYLIVVTGVTLTVLLSYVWGVRHTLIGRSLNGPRTKWRDQVVNVKTNV